MSAARVLGLRIDARHFPAMTVSNRFATFAGLDGSARGFIGPADHCLNGILGITDTPYSECEILTPSVSLGLKSVIPQVLG